MNLYNFQLKVLAGLTGLFDRCLWYTIMYIQLGRKINCMFLRHTRVTFNAPYQKYLFHFQYPH